MTEEKSPHDLIVISLGLPREILSFIDTWRNKQEIVPSRTATLNYLIKKGLEELTKVTKTREHYISPPIEEI